MMDAYITFRSVTHAQRGESVLYRAHLRASLQRTPRFMQDRGCGYSLRLSQQELTRAVSLLRENQVTFQKLYVRRGREFQELTL